MTDRTMIPGELLREARAVAGMTQQDLAVASHTAQSAISRVETGRVSPTFDTLERLVRATGSELHLTIQPQET